MRYERMFKLTHIQTGMIFGLMGYTAFAFADINAKWLVQDFSPTQILNFQSAVSILILLTLSKFIGGWRGWNNKKELPIHIMRGCMNCLVSILVVYSFSILSLAEVYAMIFAKPFLMVPLSMLVYGEKVPLGRWLVITAGFIGVLMVLQPGLDMDLNLLIPLLAATVVAVMFLSSRSLREASPFILSFYPMLVTFALTLPLLFWDFVTPNLIQIGHFFIGGCLVTAGITFVSLAFRSIDTSLVTHFLYTEMIWGILFGYLIFGDMPNFWMLAGTSVIIASGLIIIFKKEAPKES